jgi:hypothetical protein
MEGILPIGDTLSTGIGRSSGHGYGQKKVTLTVTYESRRSTRQIDG